MFARRLVMTALAATAIGAAAAPALAASAPAGPPVQLPAPPAGKGQVVFFRKPMLSLVPFNWMVREGQVELCRMVAGTYCIAAVPPGTHTFEVHSEVKNDLTLEVDSGETYYVIGSISMGMIVNRPNISPAQKAQFDAMSAKLKVEPPQPAGGGASAAPADPAKPST